MSTDPASENFLKLYFDNPSVIDKGYDLSVYFSDDYSESWKIGDFDIGAYEYVPTILTGDVNNNGVIDGDDLDACVNHILGTHDWGECC
ncbi:MAG: hypothetical protein SWO11_22950 [Thermodesulfobacteriota bacterium]|nr:hypothetical protein [Thermodesulfobacteriota bacterium]